MWRKQLAKIVFSLERYMVNIMEGHAILERAILKWLIDKFKLCKEQVKLKGVEEQV